MTTKEEVRAMSRTSWKKDEGGQAVILVAITFLALLMAVGLAIDAGQLYVARRTMQEAADSAAYAGAVVKYQGGTTVEARLAAYADATRNGYTDCGVSIASPIEATAACPLGGFHVVAYAPPTSGTWAGDSRYVQVIIWGDVRTAIVPGGALTNVRVRGTAGAEPLNNSYAIMALDRGNVEKSFYVGNTAEVDLTGGGILVNSTNARAGWSEQCDADDFKIQTPYGTDVAGTGYGCFPSTGDGLDNGQPQQADPLRGYATPSTSGLSTYGSLPGGCASSCTINPGIWTATIGGSGGTTITLNPGIYILKGGGINAGGNADIVGTNVFLFNTHTNYPGAFRTGIDSCQSIDLAGNATSGLTAMTNAYVSGLDLDGRYVGTDPQEWNYVNFLVYQDPACTAEMKIRGNGEFNGTGTIYVPTAQFTFDGTNARLTGSQLIAKRVNLQQGDIDIDFNAGTTAQPILPRLSE